LRDLRIGERDERARAPLPGADAQGDPLALAAIAAMRARVDVSLWRPGAFAVAAIRSGNKIVLQNGGTPSPLRASSDDEARRHARIIPQLATGLISGNFSRATF